MGFGGFCFGYLFIGVILMSIAICWCRLPTWCCCVVFKPEKVSVDLQACPLAFIEDPHSTKVSRLELLSKYVFLANTKNQKTQKRVGSKWLRLKMS